jgi:hypothetical protein
MNVRKNHYFSESESNIIAHKMATQPVNLKGKLNVYNDLNVTGTATIGTLDVETLDLGSSGFSTAGSISVENLFLGNGVIPQPFISFVEDADTGITNSASDELTMYTNGINRLTVNNSRVTVGTVLNNLPLVVNGIASASTFRAGDGIQGTPSFSFSNSSGGDTNQGADTGMYYVYDTSVDRLRFSAGGNFVLEMNAGQCFFNNRLLANSGLANNTTPALIFHNDSSTTGFSGQRTNASTDPRLWAIVSGVQATELTPTQFNVGLTNANNTNLKTLNQNGPSNFNAYTPNDNLVILPVTTALNGSATGSYFDCDFDATTGVYAYCNNTTTAGVARIQMTTNPNDLSNWTALTNSNFALINLTNVRSLCFGNGIWACMSHTGGTRQLYWSSTANALNTAWNQVPSTASWTSTRTLNRLRFVNGVFVTLDSASRYRSSTDCVTWTGEVNINAGSFSLTDITYSPELQRYIIVTNAGNIFYFTGSSLPTTNNVWTQVTQSGIASNFIVWSPKLSMFLGQNPATFAFNWSRDGINWNSYTPSGTWATIQICRWVNDYGGFFIGGVNQTTNNVAISRDGLNWTQFSVLNGAVNSLLYNPVAKMFAFFGTTTLARYKDNATFITNYITNDNIYNTFNSNTRFNDVIEYQNQVITPVSGDNHYTISTFRRPEVVFDTSAVNANIYLQGSSFNGRVGCKFKFIKSNSNHNVRIHAYETTTIISPTGNITSFNAQSSPQTYSIIPAGYFGSFELTRISDSGNGVWIIDNVDVYDSAGTVREIGNLSVAGVSSATAFRAGDGSVGTPAYSFTTTNESDLGLYRIGTDNLGIVSDNKTRVDIGTSQVEIGKTGAGNGLDLTVNGTITTTGAISAGSANISTTGTISSLNRRDTVTELTGTAATHTVSTSTSYNLMIRRSDGTTTDFKTISLTDLGDGQLGFTFTFFMNPISGSTNPVRISNNMGGSFNVHIYDSTLSSTAVVTLSNGLNANLLASGTFSGAKWECIFTTVNTRCWIVRRIAF